VPGRHPGRAETIGQLDEPRQAPRIALDTRVGGLAGKVGGDERRHHVGGKARLVVDAEVRRAHGVRSVARRATASGEQQLRWSSFGQSFTVAARTR